MIPFIGIKSGYLLPFAFVAYFTLNKWLIKSKNTVTTAIICSIIGIFIGVGIISAQMITEQATLQMSIVDLHGMGLVSQAPVSEIKLNI